MSHLKQKVLMTYAILGVLEHSVEHTGAELVSSLRCLPADWVASRCSGFGGGLLSRAR
jgi:hypothetical protein